MDTKGDIDFWPLSQYTAQLYEALFNLDWHNPNQNSKLLANRNATWHLCIAIVLQNAPAHLRPLDKRACAVSMGNSLTRLRVEEIPGTYRRRLSYRKTTQIRLTGNLMSQQGRAAWKPQYIEDLLDRTSVSVPSDILQQAIGDLPLASLCFEFEAPFRDLPKKIEVGCTSLISFYRNNSKTVIISTHIQATLDLLNLEDPIIQLALLLISILSIPTPLPWCPRKQGEAKFSDHSKSGREKERWCAILFLKMMWFRYPQLAVNEFLACLNTKQGRSYA